MNAYYLIILLTVSILSSCRPTHIKTRIPNCPPPHLIVKIKEGSISGEYLENVIENHIRDHECIERLKALLGKKFKGTL